MLKLGDVIYFSMFGLPTGECDPLVTYAQALRASFFSPASVLQWRPYGRPQDVRYLSCGVEVKFTPHDMTEVSGIQPALPRLFSTTSETTSS